MALEVTDICDSNDRYYKTLCCCCGVDYQGPVGLLNGRYVSATWDVDELEAMKDEIVEGDKLKFRLVV